MKHLPQKHLVRITTLNDCKVHTQTHVCVMIQVFHVL